MYVAFLGIRASSENTLRVAQWYLRGTVLVAIGWLGYNYMISLEVDEALEQNNSHGGHSTHNNSTDNHHHSNTPDEGEDDDDDDDLNVYNQALQVMILPAMVWCLCCFRAWQFQYLLQQAEQVAHDRIQNEVQLLQDQHAQEEEGQEEEGGQTSSGGTSSSNATSTTNDNDAVATAAAQRSDNNVNDNNHDEELALQNPSAVIT